MNSFPLTFWQSWAKAPASYRTKRIGIGLVWVSMVLLLAACSRIPFFGAADEEPVSASTTFVQPVIHPAEDTSSLAVLFSELEGKILFKSNRDGEERLYLMDADGGNLQPFNHARLYTEAAKLESFAPRFDHQVIVQRFGTGQYLFVRELDTEVKRQLTGGPWAYYAPAWSPQGNTIAYVADIDGRSFVTLVPVSGGDGKALLPANIGKTSHPSWSPAGDRIALTVDNGEQRQVWVANADGSNATNVSGSDFDDWDPIWIKNTAAIPVDKPTALDPALDQMSLSWSVDRCLVRIEVVDRFDGRIPIERVQIMSAYGIKFDSGPIAARDFRETLVLDLLPGTHAVELRIWNADRYKEEPFALPDTLFCFAETPTATPSPSPTAFVIEPTPQPSDVFDAATRVASGPQPATQPLPVGAVVATTTPQPVVVTNTPTPENAATAEYESAFATAIAATTGTPTAFPAWWVTATPTPTETPTSLPTETPVSVPWQPRGVLQATPQPTSTQPVPAVLSGKILFQSDRDGHNEYYVINPDGSNIQKLTAPWPYQQAIEQDTLSQNGIYRVYVARDDKNFQIFFHDAEFKVDERVSLLGNGDAWDPAIDPSGWRVAFVSNEAGNDELYVVNRDGSELRRLTNNEWEWDRRPSWSPDGSEIVFWSNRGGRKQLYIVSYDGSNLRLLSDGFADDWDPVWVK